MGMSGVSKSQVSRLCKDIDVRVKAFLERPIEGDWPFVWLDATYLKARHPACKSEAPKVGLVMPDLRRDAAADRESMGAS